MHTMVKTESTECQSENGGASRIFENGRDLEIWKWNLHSGVSSTHKVGAILGPKQCGVRYSRCM